VTTADVRTLQASLRKDAVLIEVPSVEIQPVTGDPEDDAVLATVRLGKADYLVTGDRGLLDLGAYAGARIVSRRDFLTALDQ
jgi:predicted nucleic acid-binding protein